MVIFIDMIMKRLMDHVFGWVSAVVSITAKIGYTGEFAKLDSNFCSDQIAIFRNLLPACYRRIYSE